MRFVSQNILHGVGCPPDSDSCRVSERVSLFMAQLSEAGCPELVSIQEANERIVGLVVAEAGACGYAVVWDDDPGLDREVVLTTLNVIGSRRRILADRFRSAYLVRVASPIGVIDFLTTHLASSDDRACDPGLCPPPCDAAGRLRTCQARQVLEFAEDVALDAGVTVVGGDLNDSAGSPPLAVFDDAGFDDSHAAAGLGECDPSSGTGCTAGRDDTSLSDMTDPSTIQGSRIDYLLYRAPGRDCSVGEGTGLFNAEPAAGELAFPSDHTAVALTLVCDAAKPEGVDLVTAGLPEEFDEPDAADGQPVDEITAETITTTFETYLDGSITDIELRIGQVEDLEGLRPKRGPPGLRGGRRGRGGCPRPGRLDLPHVGDYRQRRLFDPAERSGHLRWPGWRGDPDRRPLVRLEGHLLRSAGPVGHRPPRRLRNRGQRLTSDPQADRHQRRPGSGPALLGCFGMARARPGEPQRHLLIIDAVPDPA